MKKYHKLVIVSSLVVGIAFGWKSHAHAYIDPGTTSVVFSMLASLLTGFLFLLGLFFRPIIAFVRRVGRFARGRPVVSVLCFVAVLSLGGGFVYYTLMPQERGTTAMVTPASSKVLLIGIDGLDAKVMERLLDEGHLPNFARLKEIGTYRRLSTTNPAQSPVAWSTIATGSNPGYHGIFDFIRRDPKTYLPALAILRSKSSLLSMHDSSFVPVRHGKSFWDITAEAGIPSTVIRWPITFPPKRSGATVLAGLGVPDLRGHLGNYSYYTTDGRGLEGEGSEKVQHITLRDGIARTSIVGPTVASIKGNKNADIPLHIDLNGHQGSVTLMVGDQKVQLGEKRWSDWVRMKFNVGMMRHVSGMAKFYLVSTKPDLNLYMTAIQVDPREPAFPISQPPEFAAELAQRVGDYHTLGMPEDTKALSEGRLDEASFLKLCQEVHQERLKMLWSELERFEKEDRGLFAFVFDTTDRIQHMFWRFENLDHPANEPTKGTEYDNVIETYYTLSDWVVGQLLDRTGEETTLIVFSDHGFSTFRRAVHLNSWLVEQGFMTLKPKAEESGDGELFQNVDWSETKAYALGFGSVFLNIRGREGQGVVNAGAEAEQVRGAIAKKLMELKDPKTGESIVRRVYKREELYHGPHLDDAPDLVVGFKPGYRFSWQTAIGGAPAGILEDNKKKWSGDHLVDPIYVPGILFMNQKTNVSNPRLMDLAPTVLAALGVEMPPEMEGTSLLGR
jgi:predicted AlkP superfamily phosphohydrolase/phosphomutase